jgi:hypothetical protein
MADKPDTAATNAASDSAAALNTGKPADLPPAETITPAGAPVQIVPDVDMSHPAVDANPRERTTDLQNRIDFNDPSLPSTEAVEQKLGKQAKA